jgi:hypothetical protein
MSHLSDIELVDFIDEDLPPGRAAHVDRCESCRARVASLRETISRTSEVDIPEPSPLFWEHFGARVRESVNAAEIEQPAGRFEWLRSPVAKWAASGAFVAFVLMATMWPATAPTVKTPAVGPVAQLASPAAPSEPVAPDAAIDMGNAMGDPDRDAAWALVRTVADDASWDDVVGAGLAAAPESTDLAARTLSAPERAELVRLLQAEIKQPGA